MLHRVKNVWETVVVAFSMYSAVPMPQICWTEENMKYALAAFPLVGVLEGALLLGWAWVAAALRVQPLLFAALAVAIPLVLTGGIHMDGFCDTVDALSSHQPREEKLRILQDPQAGAFAVVFAGGYLLVQAGLWAQLWELGSQDSGCLFAGVGVVSGGCVLGRCLSGGAVVALPSARKKGLAATFSQAAAQKRRRVLGALGLLAVLSAGWMASQAVWPALAAWAALALVTVGFYRMCQKEFGGITGDLAGWFFACGQLAMLAAVTGTMLILGR